MKKNPNLLAAIILVFLLFAGLAYAQEASGRRVALVIGNGTYQANPLRNPPNDAEDVAAALKDSGFEVTLVLNTSLEVLEKTVDEFSVKLRGAETALFYYAGHGVQVGGLNYLIPVSPRIDDEASVRSRAVAVDVVVGKMEATGVRTALVFLDSCRDNPFPSASRSETRGLAVIAAPKTVNSLIAYATSPGDVAQDGSGRNGVFSGAFIKQLREPGLELNVIMRNVKSEVASVSGNKQQPRVDDGMKEPFYFISPDAVADKARAERDKIASELAVLEAQIAARDQAIDSARTAAERSSLEVEQQTQKALEDAKRIESENARREAQRLETETEARKAEEESRRNRSASEAARTAALKAQADARRAEYEKFTRSDDSLPAFLKEIAALESALSEIAKRYAAAALQAEADIRRFYVGKVIELGKQKADPWESDDEFKVRIAKEQKALDSARDAEISARKSSLSTEQGANETELRARLEKAERDLAGKTYTVKGQAVSVLYGAFDREKKAWPVAVSSKDPILLYSAALSHDLSQASDLKTAYTAVDTALKAGALAGEMDYGISRLPGSDRFLAVVKEVRVRDLTTAGVVLRSTPNVGLYVMSAAAPEKRTWLIGTLSVTTSPSGARVEEGGRYLGTTPLQIEITLGEHPLTVSWPDTGFVPVQTTAVVKIGLPTQIALRGSAIDSVFVQGGTYRRERSQVTVSSFQIGKYEVTQAQYQRVVGKNPSKFTGDPQRPVEQVSWYDAVGFCNALSKSEGLNPVYTINGNNVTADFWKSGWRLPTEAEWEYAARGGNGSRGYTYSGAEDADAVAWYSSNSNRITQPVGRKQPNELGLYDMSGNVWEWCWDWYGSYPSGAQTDPTGGSSGPYRVIRGGSWGDVADYGRVSLRYIFSPDNRDINYGFRVLRRPQ